MTEKELEVRNKREIDSKGENTYQCKVYVPDVDIFETENEIVIEADIPGVKKKDVSVKLEDNVLVIEAQVNPEGYKNLVPLYGEYNIGHYRREFTIGESVEQEKIGANVKNGVLKIVLPKEERVKPRKITVN